jgi:hypothetical protein
VEWTTTKSRHQLLGTRRLLEPNNVRVDRRSQLSRSKNRLRAVFFGLENDACTCAATRQRAFTIGYPEPQR